LKHFNRRIGSCVEADIFPEMSSDVKPKVEAGVVEVKLAIPAKTQPKPLDSTRKLSEGDLVVFRTRYPQDMMPNYGKIIAHNHPLAIHTRTGGKKNAPPAPVNPWDNMADKYYVHWERSQNVQLVRREDVIIKHSICFVETCTSCQLMTLFYLL